MKVKAIRPGTDQNGRYREGGEVFDYQLPDGCKKGYWPSWLEKLEPEKPGRQKPGPAKADPGESESKDAE